MNKAVLIQFTVLMFLSSVSFGSQEGILPIGDFEFHSPGTNSSGSVYVLGKTNPEGRVTEITIEVFGKTYKVNNSIISNIPATVNGVHLSHEEGYKGVGGQTVYITFVMGFTSGTSNIISIGCSEENNDCVLIE